MHYSERLNRGTELIWAKFTCLTARSLSIGFVDSMLGIPVGSISLGQQTENQVNLHPMSARTRTLRYITLNHLEEISMRKGSYVARLELRTCRFSSVNFEGTSRSNE